jgi:hypothetical protein
MEWKKVNQRVEFKLSAEQAGKIGLPAVSGTIRMVANHSGYDYPASFGYYPEDSQPPEFDLEIHRIFDAVFEDDNGNEIEVRERHYDAMWNDADFWELLIDAIMEGN